MRVISSDIFQDMYNLAPSNIRKSMDKQIRLLTSNLQHPSLHAKKYNETTGLWQARVNKDWRFYFTIEGDTYLLHSIIPHPK